MGYRQRNPEEVPSTVKDKDKELDKPPSNTEEPQQPARPADLHVDLPPPPTSPFTLSHNATPGWDTPWSSRAPRTVGLGVHPYHRTDDHPDQDVQDDEEKLSTWQARRKRFRVYILYNAYVPLVRSYAFICLSCISYRLVQLFRIFNIVLTTAALVMAIQIRKVEERHGIMGALGSSP